MKRFLITSILTLFVLFSAIAVNKNDVVMVSYEQSWLDSEGTLALKNNTSQEIHNVSFLITYLDMSGNELDYEEFAKRVSIAPGMTRKLDIPAYEHSRNYHYYKSENMPSGSPAFKIKFELKDYNFVEEKSDEEDNYDGLTDYDYSRKTGSNSELWYPVIAIVAVLVVIGISVGLYVLVAVMAQRRHRNVVLWVLLSIIASPILIIIILLVVGDDYKQIDNFDKE